MTEEEYLRESASTLSASFHTELCSRNELEAMFYAAQVAGDWADRVKKGLFYGREFVQKTVPHMAPSLQYPTDPNLLHAVLGIFTEAAELMEHYCAVLKGETPLDEVNMVEEVGDLLWYCAIIWRATNSLPSETMGTNIAKLRTRFPDKFTEEAAKQRDLFAERKVLEGP